jgi:hypothetical protein
MYPSPKISAALDLERYGAAPRRALYNNAVSVAKQESRTCRIRHSPRS